MKQLKHGTFFIYSNYCNDNNHDVTTGKQLQTSHRYPLKVTSKAQKIKEQSL
jgi:hypothetical protein